MAGRGTGVPNFFMCPNERRQRHYARALGDPDRIPWHKVTLTGRTRPYNTGNHPPRSTATRREYRCTYCGHVGWSNHVDLERREAK
jgi:hypothetical protein